MSESMAPDAESVLATIPPAATVREMLGQNLREIRLLKQMLKLAEQAERERSQRKAVAHG